MLSGTEVDRLDGYCGTTADQSSLGCCGWWQDIPMTNELEIVTVRGHRKRSRHDWWPSPHMSLGVFSLFEPDLLYLTVLKHQHISRVDTFRKDEEPTGKRIQKLQRFVVFPWKYA